jgi:hypothetical protein
MSPDEGGRDPVGVDDDEPVPVEVREGRVASRLIEHPGARLSGIWV